MSRIRIDRQTFLENLRRSGLLTDQELRSALKRLPETNRGRVVARALVEGGLLTKFQAELLLVGRTGGFTLGQYRILDQIGAGGMGRVFKARHRTMNRIVALKVLAPHLMNTERARQLFQREVQAAGQLMHPNIVTAYDANEVGGRHFLVMEYVDGPNLDQLVRERGPLPVGLACDLIRQTAHGLQCAAERGMVHRDIKPANLLVQRSPAQNASLPCVVKILDFGLARLQAGDDGEATARHTIVTTANMVMGTPDFVSPEQARDMHKVDIRSDLYSLGCTFYYLLSGCVPFPGGNAADKLIRQNAQQPTPLEELRPEVPSAVADIVRRLMAKKPGDRFQTPADLATALAPFAKPGPAADHLPQKPLALAGDSDGLTPEPGTAAAARGNEVPGQAGALVGTLPPDLSPTPLTTEDMLLAAPASDDAASRRRLKATLFCAVSLITSLAGVIGFLLFGR